MATWLGMTQAQLSRVENKAAPEQLSRLVHWAEVLRIPGELLWFALPKSTAIEAARAPERDDESEIRLAHSLLTGSENDSSDSDFGEIGAKLADAYRCFDGPIVDFLREQLALCKRIDGAHGPTAALPRALNIVAATRRQTGDAKPDARPSLLTLGADGAEFIGWLYRDLRRPLAAGYWYDRAIEMAQEAGDLPMQGYVLLRKSQMAYDDRDSVRVLTFAQAADRGPWRLPITIRAEVVQQEARGLAMQGATFDVIARKLDEADELRAARPSGSEGGDVHTHLLRAASCYLEAGKPAKAAALFATVLESTDLSGRDEGYFRARRATALALSGEPDGAAAEGLAAMRRATEKQSVRTREELLRAVEAMERWRHRPGPRELREALSPDHG
ncbi:XRE family transcriptional regulator [Nocardia sp. NPDC003482]